VTADFNVAKYVRVKTQGEFQFEDRLKEGFKKVMEEIKEWKISWKKGGGQGSLCLCSLESGSLISCRQRESLLVWLDTIKLAKFLANQTPVSAT
jgi:hypothetical protein